MLIVVKQVNHNKLCKSKYSDYFLSNMTASHFLQTVNKGPLINIHAFLI